jgi:molybdopterin molybdotransferase
MKAPSSFGGRGHVERIIANSDSSREKEPHSRKVLVVISEDEARAKILEQIQPLPGQRVGLLQALDRFAAKDYVARVALPAFDNSAMDGYAVVANSCGVGKQLRVIGEQPAGVDRQLRVEPGEAVRIFTGAPVPAGADAVVMQEEVTRDGDQIVINDKVESGDFVRRRGCDLSEGQRILDASQQIRPAVLGLLASQGFNDVEVGGEVDAAILSTGDELAQPGQKLRPGQIYESNATLLQALLKRSGVNVRSVEHCSDERSSLTEAIKRGAQHRALIISGGVSVGEHDFVRPVLETVGGTIHLWQVAIKPGKPFLFGRIGECAVFGLPGNPVSSFVTFLRLVRPALLKMMGASEWEGRKIGAQLTVDLRNDGDRTHYLRGKFEEGTFSPVGRQESHALFGLSQSNALLRVLPGEKLAQGSAVEVEIWD